MLLLSMVYVFLYSQFTVAQEAEYLLSFKRDIVDGLGFLSDWNRDSALNNSHCKWTGITCDNDYQVTNIDISSKNLTGLINSHIGKFRSLSYLNLSINSFSGSLPKEITELVNLDVLDISENQFSGKIPAGISRLKLLTFFSAHDNNFTGEMPVEVSQMTSLEHLDLAGSYFTGRIPREYSNLTQVQTLKLSGNLLTGEIPREFGLLTELRHLELGYNNYTGGIPPEIGFLRKLVYLDISWTGLSGSIPPELGRLTECHTVFLYKNRLSGSIPPELGNMSNLLSLDLSDNMLNGSIPSSLGGLGNLRLLHLMMNRLTGPLPEDLGELPYLETLSVWSNSISGDLPRSLGRSKTLWWIDVSSNRLTGKIPRGICSGGSLVKLELFSNRLSGTIPDVTNCQRLLRARLHDNRLTGPIPGSFGTMHNLTRLELSGNLLNGTIPVGLCSAQRLSYFDISDNQIQGTLPKQLWSLPQLQELHASGNLLSGEIPPDISEATKLSVLDLSNNAFTGRIPPELSYCTKLVTVNLHGNNLTGSIPIELSSLPVLAVLDLSSNSLQGRIPVEFTQSLSLEDFNISYNGLQGQLPMTGIFSTAPSSSFLGNPGLCGGVLPPCSRTNDRKPSGSGQLKTVREVLIAVFFVLSVVVLLFVLRFLYRRYGWKCLSCCRDRELVDESSSDWPWKMTTFQRVGFTIEELLESVQEKNIIGKGAMGVVYKAEMASGEIVALKQLCNNKESYHIDQGFISEIKVLGGIRHRNIVRLLGYCSNNCTDMLIYEYMPNGSLSDILHGQKHLGILQDWVSRYNIAMGVAQGIAYLHHDCSPNLIIHRDVKSSNILLDHNMEARVADFGLAKLMEARESMSVVAGSYGYIAPEYAYTMKVREKGDIYSYGVVLLELLTGKRPIEPEYGEGNNIVDWVHSKLRTGRLVDVLDWSIGGCDTVQEEMLLVLRISILCTSRSPRDRPSMRDVVSMLQEAKPRRKQIKSFSIVHMQEEDEQEMDEVLEAR